MLQLECSGVFWCLLANEHRSPKKCSDGWIESLRVRKNADNMVKLGKGMGHTKKNNKNNNNKNLYCKIRSKEKYCKSAIH